jgi:CRP/FNR family cyclic AMP-dependent transcriptional regulator
VAKLRARESAKSSAYDPAVALEFFGSAGKPQDFVKGATIFSENRVGLPLLLMPNRMYLLLEGEVGLFAGDEHIASIHSGEVFGEMAALGGTARSATALAMFDCKVIGLDEAQFGSALRRNPAFALMLMGVMAARLRDTIGRLGGTSLPADGGWHEAAALDPQMLSDLVSVVGPAARFRYPAGKQIMREGQRGVALYAVLEGRVEIRIGDTVVEKVGPGGVFGEMSLVERKPRLASAAAETDCALLAMSRHMFLHLVKQSPKFGQALLKAVGERAAFMASRLPKAAPAEGKAAAA